MDFEKVRLPRITGRSSWSMKMNKIVTLLLLLAAMLCSGCGTFMARVAFKDALGDELYPAVKLDAGMIKGCLDPDGTIFTRKSYAGAVLTMLDVPISAATDTLFLPADLSRRYEHRKKEERRKTVSAKVEKVRAAIRQNPQVIFDEGWHTSKRYTHTRAIIASLGDPDVPFTEDMIRRLLDEAPVYKRYAFQHPCCSSDFLANHFDEAYEMAKGVDHRMLAAIVSHRNTPIEFVRRIAASQEIPVGAVHAAQRELKRREKERELQDGSTGR